ncbi:hypothetical protein IU487_33180 [Nocardia puris]|uniref:Hydrolase of the HAD superfamily n=1 Tax=Nocardia puris TaxID=208602 RepID=A0A366D5Q1_9NOCA|nr:hypothetical protein [Nocardia puris]MBF6215853.1 hypothetical protein [Nocardia puris]RBO85286.1 hypothetical protein DFR74_115134 [Nocardia puris]
MNPAAQAAAELDALMLAPRHPRVVFCDWHGVLSRAPYWHSITENRDHPLHSALNSELGRLFTTGNSDGRDWMCGRLSTREILTRATARHPHLDVDELCAKLADDLTTTPVDPTLLCALVRAREQATVVLATDNISDFAAAFNASSLAPEAGADVPTLQTAAAAFDELLCSSALGVLKRHDPTGYFGQWLAATGRGFADALLIDDNPDNCSAFAAAGGSILFVSAPMPVEPGQSRSVRGPLPSRCIITTSVSAESFG